MGKVIELKLNTAYDHIMFYLNGLESENTRKKYEKDIKRFVKWKYNIPLEHLQPEHFNSLTYTDMKKYRDYLRRKFSVSTTNGAMIALYSLFKELNRYQDSDGNYIYNIDVERLRVRLFKNNQVEAYGDIEWEEVDQMIEYLKNSDIPNKEAKWIWLHIARLTGIRKTGMVNLRFKDLKKISKNEYILTHRLKGKKYEIPLRKEDAELLLSLKREGDTEDSKILGLSEKTLERTFDMLKEAIGIDESRNVTIHSLRNLAAWEAYCSSNSILAVQKLMNHESIETTYQYIKRRQEKLESPTLYMGLEMDGEKVKHLTGEQIAEIFNNLSRSAQYEIVKRMEELGYSQE